MDDKTKILEIEFEHAWKYFSLHASQRMYVFNFYILLVGLLVAGFVQTFSKDFNFPSAGAAIGLIQAIVSFSFWRLDRRTRFLIKMAEEALINLEDNIFRHSNTSSMIFTRENIEASKKQKSLFSTYTQCLQPIYLTFGLFGILGALVSIANITCKTP